MTLRCLQALTWATVSGAVASALMLASGEPGWSDAVRRHAASLVPFTGSAPTPVRVDVAPRGAQALQAAGAAAVTVRAERPVVR